MFLRTGKHRQRSRSSSPAPLRRLPPPLPLNPQRRNSLPGDPSPGPRCGQHWGRRPAPPSLTGCPLPARSLPCTKQGAAVSERGRKATWYQFSPLGPRAGRGGGGNGDLLGEAAGIRGNASPSRGLSSAAPPPSWAPGGSPGARRAAVWRALHRRALPTPGARAPHRQPRRWGWSIRPVSLERTPLAAGLEAFRRPGRRSGLRTPASRAPALTGRASDQRPRELKSGWGGGAPRTAVELRACAVPPCAVQRGSHWERRLERRDFLLPRDLIGHYLVRREFRRSLTIKCCI